MAAHEKEGAKGGAAAAAAAATAAVAAAALVAAHEPLLGHLCSSRECGLMFAVLMCCAAVSRSWRNAVLSGLPTLHALDFRGHEARLAGADVMRALTRVAGANLRFVNLGGCRWLSGADMAQIMGVVRASCGDAQTTVDVSGCSDEARLSAVAECAQSVLGVASPCALFEHLTSLHEGSSLCPDAALLERLQEYLTLDAEFTPGRGALSTAAEHGSVWIVALLLGVAYAVGDEGEIRTFDCNERNRNGQRLIHFAAARGDKAMFDVLVSARADLNPADGDGNTPLLAAIAGGHLELAEILIAAGAGISAANRKGNTPLLAAIGGGHLDLAKALIEAGANVETTRQDGAGLLALAIVSQKEEFINFAFQHGPRRLERQVSSSAASDVAQFSQLFLDPSQIGNWLQGGASPQGLVGEIGALLRGEMGALLSALETTKGIIGADHAATLKVQLGHVRAFVDHHHKVLQNPPVSLAHTVTQLAAQEPDVVFGGGQATMPATETANQPAMIEWLNKPQTTRPCQWTLQAGESVNGVAYSSDGTRLARAVGNDVVVCDAVSGFEVCRLTGHRYFLRCMQEIQNHTYNHRRHSGPGLSNV